MARNIEEKHVVLVSISLTHIITNNNWIVLALSVCNQSTLELFLVLAHLVNIVVKIVKTRLDLWIIY